MSSTYRAICMAHMPPLELGEFGANTAEGALSTGRDGPHAECDLILGRYSGALVEIGCPPPGGHPGIHREIQWTDVAWLRVAAVAFIYAANGDTRPALDDALDRIPNCWRGARLVLLRPLLIEEPTVGVVT